MTKWYEYGPMGFFVYQVFLAFNGRDPLSIYSFVPSYVISDITELVKAAIV